MAVAALEAGHRVTLLLGAGVSVGLRADVEAAAARAAKAARATMSAMSPAMAMTAKLAPPLTVVPFVSVADLQRALASRFAAADALVMAAAVGDFRPESVSPTKLRRRGGPITLRLVPTQDVLASVAATKKPGQRIVAFAVEDGPRDDIEAKARREMIEKHADFVVLNPPAAMGTASSQACILTRDGVALPWGERPKTQLAAEIVKLLPVPCGK